MWEPSRRTTFNSLENGLFNDATNIHLQTSDDSKKQDDPLLCDIAKVAGWHDIGTYEVVPCLTIATERRLWEAFLLPRVLVCFPGSPRLAQAFNDVVQIVA